VSIADGFITGRADFTLSKAPVQFKANGTTVESGVLLSIGLTDLALKIGTDEFGVSITQGSVAVASLAPTAAGDTRRWLAVVADNVTASVNAGSLLSITVSALDVVISQQTPAGTPSLDWSAELSLDNDAIFNEAADALTIANLAIDPAADTLLVSGDNATVSIADGFITGRRISRFRRRRCSSRPMARRLNPASCCRSGFRI
jgi:hypothetical protein